MGRVNPGLRTLTRRKDHVHGLIRWASTLNTDRIDHIYRDPQDADARLFSHYNDLANEEQLMIEREQGVVDALLLID